MDFTPFDPVRLFDAIQPPERTTLIDSLGTFAQLCEEKNQEIDRLRKEVTQLRKLVDHPVDMDGRFAFAETTARAFPNTRIELRDIAPVDVPKDYVVLGDDHGAAIQGKSFENGSSIVVHCLLF